MTAAISVRHVHIQTEAAKSMLRALALSTNEVDEELVHDSVEGETNLFEAFDRVVARIRQLEGYGKAITDEVATLKARAERFEAQADNLRQSVLNAMQELGLPKVERAYFTLVLSKAPPSCLIVSESEIPTKFLIEKVEVKPDKKAILAALKDGVPVPGAELRNSAPTLNIRKK